MKHILSLAATFALSLPVAAIADETKPKSEQGRPGASQSPAGTSADSKATASKQSAPAARTWSFQFGKPLEPGEFEKRMAEYRKHSEERRKEARDRMLKSNSEMRQHIERMFREPRSAEHDALRERVRRQRDLTKQATKLLKKLDELDSDESPKARELWAQLERTQAELQQTFGGPQAFSIGTAPGQPAGGWVVQTSEGPLGGTVTGGGFGGGMVSGGGIVSSGNVIVSSAQPQLQANPGAPHVRQLKVAAPSQNAAPQPSNAEVLKAIEALNARIKMLEEKISKSSNK